MAVDDAALDTAVEDGAAPDQHRPDAARTDAGANDASPRDAATDVMDSHIGDAAVMPGCAAYTAAIEVARLPPDTLAEVSGIAASRQSPGVLWMHNDSGNAPAVYAIDTAGQVRMRVPLPATAQDLEDIAIARCPTAERWCVFVGDIGDNRRVRDAVRIFVVPEPPVPAEWDGGDRIVDGIVTLRRTWPDGAQDAEALVVSPAGDRLWIFSKVEDAPTQIVSSNTVDLRGELAEITTFDAPGVAVPMGRMVTGADLHPDGERLIVRVYTGSYEYVLGASGLAGLADRSPRTVSLGPLSESQGEAIGYAADSDSIWTVSEAPGGGQPLHRYDCR